MGIVCYEGQTDSVVMDFNIGMMSCSFSHGGDLIDERHGRNEVLKRPIVNQLPSFEFPLRKPGQRVQ